MEPGRSCLARCTKVSVPPAAAVKASISQGEKFAPIYPVFARNGTTLGFDGGSGRRRKHRGAARVKLASFHAAGRDRIGVLVDGYLVDVSTAIPGSDEVMDGRPRTMLELIEAGEPARERVQRIADSEAAGSATGERFNPDEVLWHAPVRRPSKICCVALNNSANADRIIRGPKHPAMFIKPGSALVGHGGAIE